MRTKSIRSALAVACFAAVAAGCGGGGGGGGAGGGGGGPTPPPDPTWTSGVFQVPATFAAYCAIPRTGTDPSNGKPYADKLGSTVWENNWIRAWTNAYYLWYSRVTDANPSGHSTADYFNLMRTNDKTSTGQPQDRFHFTYPTTQWEALSQSGVNIGYGVAWLLLATTPPRELRVGYIEPLAPATTVAAILPRGASVLMIDGVDLVNAGDQTSVDKLNAGISPSTAGESHTFVIEDTPGGPQRTVTLTAANITETPVQHVATFVQPDGGVVGYIEFDDHIATAESQLVAAFNQLVMASTTDLVLDIRYNGGGYLDIASEVAYMIAGPGQTTNQTFEQEIFNDKYPTTDPITGLPLTPTPFWSFTQGFSTTQNQPLPHLDLHRVFVLTTGDTCSASEAIINSLNGVGVNVVQVGSTTCGKPYGFYPADNCGTTYFSIQFRGVNNIGFGGYPDGFTPANSPTPTTAPPLPGCSVADDFTHHLGDPNEAQFAAALAYRRANGAAGCPTASGNAAPIGPTAKVTHRVKPEVLMNRILRHPH